MRQDFSQGGGVNLGGLNWDSSGLQREHIDFKEYKRNFKAKGILFYFIMGAWYSLNLHVIYVAHWSLNSVLYIHSPRLPPHPPLIYNFMSGRLWNNTCIVHTAIIVHQITSWEWEKIVMVNLKINCAKRQEKCWITF